jgi:hypothetical protein
VGKLNVINESMEKKEEDEMKKRQGGVSSNISSVIITILFYFNYIYYRYKMGTLKMTSVMI